MMAEQLTSSGPSFFKALFSAGLLGGAAVGFIIGSVAPAKAQDLRGEFLSVISFKWNLGDTVTVAYGPQFDFKGVSVTPGVKLDINIRNLDLTNLSLIGSIYYDMDGTNINANFNIPIAYSPDPATWAVGVNTPFAQDGLTGTIEYGTTGQFSDVALSDAASSARFGLNLNLPGGGGFGFNTKFGFSDSDSLGLRSLDISQNLILDGSSFKLGLIAPVNFFLNDGKAGDPPPPTLVPPIFPDISFFEPEGFFHTPGTGYVYSGRGKLNPGQEFGLTTTNVPGPLPILGAAAAFGFSRKLRKRLKSSKPEVISTTEV